MKFDFFCHGEKPPAGYTFIIGLHGGGGCPAEENDSQYCNHLHLYDKKLPKQCIWFVPRSCEDEWDMWWHSYLVEFFARIIQSFTFTNRINPNKVFISGYSAGGDGIYHLGSMLADYLAGAAMMAGHPNNAQLYNMRNISFSIQVGGQDKAYERNDHARKYIQKMKELN